MFRSVGLLLLSVATLAAHPLPTLRYDRTVDVRLTAVGVFVRYTLELNQFSIVLDREGAPTPAELAAIDKSPPSQKQLEKFYAKKKAAILADRLNATANGRTLRFRSEASPELHPNRDHLEFRYRFFAQWPADLDRTASIDFRLHDSNFESMSGKISLTLKADSGLNVIDLIDPGGLRGVSPLELKPGDEARLTRASAIFELPAKATPPTLPTSGASEPVIVGDRPGLVRDIFERGLSALFDSDAGIGLLLLAAALFGMAHAFTPGHGKTLVAAYLIGERGTMRHALALGLSTTLAHTGSVIAIAVGLWWFYRDGVPQTAQGWLQLVGGLLIFIVGFWLLRQRLAGRADHVHLFQDHKPRESFGWGRVLLLGLGGGLIPCWDAVMLLLVAIAAGRLGFAIPMLIAFSLGLAVVLVTLGIGVVLAHRAGLSRYGERRWFRALPILSAALLMAMGLWLARDGTRQLSALRLN